MQQIDLLKKQLDDNYNGYMSRVQTITDESNFEMREMLNQKNEVINESHDRINKIKEEIQLEKERGIAVKRELKSSDVTQTN